MSWHENPMLLGDAETTGVQPHLDRIGKALNDEEVASIVTFLKSLKGEIPKDYIAQPKLPASGPDTPGE